MGLIDFIAQRCWALEEGVFSRLLALAGRATRAQVVESAELRAAVVVGSQRRGVVLEERRGAMAMDDEGMGPRDPEKDAELHPFMVGSVGVVPIDGVLAPHASMVNGGSQPEGTTPAHVIRAVAAMVNDPRCSAVVLDFDSPGGSVGGIEEAASAIAAMSKSKPICAFAHGMMCSAAYWIGSQAGGGLSISKTGVGGGVGVYAVVDDASKAFDEMGVKRHVVRSGVNKGTIVDGVPVTENALANVQSEVDHLYGVMLADVARGRGVSQKNLAPSADGRAFVGSQAVDAGLADRVESFGELVAGLEKKYGKKAGPQSGQKGPKMMTEQELAAKEQELSAREAKVKESEAASARGPAKVAATFPELKAAFGPKSGGAGFIVECLDKGCSMPEAHAAWAERCELAAADAEKRAAKAQAEAQRGPFRPGAHAGNGGPHAPHAAAGGEDEDPCAEMSYMQVIAHLQKTEKLTVSDAVTQAALRYPEKRNAYSDQVEKNAAQPGAIDIAQRRRAKAV